MKTSAVFAYRKAWKALNTMLEEGESYSGFERNSAFLNLGNATDGSPRFADVSGATGLHVLDDGRSIGVVDWDCDGKLDFWATNRTAPRVRLQHNRSITRNRFVALKLTGKTCNRLAIGARAIVKLKGSDARLVRTVSAGDGFLAQSSSWLHFGIMEGDEIESVQVRWPYEAVREGHHVEEVSGVRVGEFFTIHQGDGQAQAWQPPVVPSFPKVELPPVVTSQQARIVMASRLPLPNADYTNLDGAPLQVDGKGQPLLINLWATWCAPCLGEMKEWSEREDAIRSSGIGVLALSVDLIEASTDQRITEVQPFLDKLKFPFAAGLAEPEFLEMLEVAGRAQLDKFDAFPIPSSILLDANRQIAVIYKGPVSVEQLVADSQLLVADPAIRHRQAAHFPGIWIEGPWPPTPTVMIDKFMSFGKPEAAKAYLDAFTVTADIRANQGLAESYFLVANELRIQGNEEESLVAYARTLELNPGKTRAHLDMGTVLFKLNRFSDAAPHLRAAVTAQPDVENTRKMLSLALMQTQGYAEASQHLSHLIKANPIDPIAHLWMAHALVRTQKEAAAIVHFKESLRLQPKSHVVANDLAWLLATHRNPEIRNPTEALDLASASAAATQRRSAGILDTLAAAQAANGDFAAAVRTADEAIQHAISANDPQTLKGLQFRRGLYQQGKPYRASGSAGN
ncbi:MAG: tetratricopeptide (TPR) repeat protein [Verrucomicrobiales bacterium]|jgi:tetratricopeptide (TPR) repeat protein